MHPQTSFEGGTAVEPGLGHIRKCYPNRQSSPERDGKKLAGGGAAKSFCLSSRSPRKAGLYRQSDGGICMRKEPCSRCHSGFGGEQADYADRAIGRMDQGPAGDQGTAFGLRGVVTGGCAAIGLAVLASPPATVPGPFGAAAAMPPGERNKRQKRTPGLRPGAKSLS